jgi:UDP-glucose 4-epimerase
MKIIVTGSSGFIGTHLVKKLRELKHEVTELDIINGIDITDWEQINNISRFDVFIHLAARIFVPDSYKFPREMYNLNIGGTLNVLELCRINNAKMVYASSYVYGVPQYLPIDEKHPTVAFNPYCRSKLISEDLCRSYNEDFGVPIVVFRPFNIYGKGLNENLLIPLILSQIRKSGKIILKDPRPKRRKSGKIILKDPRPKRDFIHVDDAVAAYIKALDFKSDDLEIFNLGSGISYSVKEIAEMLASNFSEDIKIEFSNEIRKNEVLDTVADISSIKNKVGWEPVISFSDGLKGLCV